MEGNCPKCGAVERYEPFRLNERIFAAYWKCGTNKTVGGQLERGSECYEAEIAVLTQRAEQAEAAVDANWVTHQQVIAANNRAFAAKAREKRLREGIERILPEFNCKMFQEYHRQLKALLAQPSGGDGQPGPNSQPTQSR